MKHFWAALKKYATFSGRASRAEYFYFAMPLLLLSNVVAYGIADILLTGVEEDIQGMTELEIRIHISGLERMAQALTILVFLPFLLPLWAVTVRRLHDYGWSGWWALAVAAVLRFVDVASQSAMDGVESIPAIILLSLLPLIVWVFVGLPESDTDENKYGVPPGQEGDETSPTLIKAGAQVNNKDDNGWTPLHFAAYNSETTTALALIKDGARLDMCTDNDKTPLDIAIEKHGKDSAIAIFLHGAMEKQHNKERQKAEEQRNKDRQQAEEQRKQKEAEEQRNKDRQEAEKLLRELE